MLGVWGIRRGVLGCFVRSVGCFGNVGGLFGGAALLFWLVGPLTWLGIGLLTPCQPHRYPQDEFWANCFFFCCCCLCGICVCGLCMRGVCVCVNVYVQVVFVGLSMLQVYFRILFARYYVSFERLSCRLSAL